MKRRLFSAVTLGIALFATFAVFKVGVLPAAPAARPDEASAANDPYSTASALRYRRCQENHWRACIMQR